MHTQVISLSWRKPFVKITVCAALMVTEFMGCSVIRRDKWVVWLTV